MALIIGIIGSLICVYAVGYMETYHHHHTEIRDRRNLFFGILFIFLSAMFGLVFSNNLLWVFFFWEITTICSFLLIGYSRSEEATNNSFLALSMNLLGGVAFMAALIYLVVLDPTGRLPWSELPHQFRQGSCAGPCRPDMLCAVSPKQPLCPFPPWLVGAMVAPTPVSALLHSGARWSRPVFILS